MKKILTVLLVMGILATSGCSDRSTSQSMGQQLRTSLKKFASCNELNKYISNQQPHEQIAINDSIISDAGPGGESITNLQEAGADEAGTVKVSSQLIITANDKSLQVINRRNLQLLGSLKMDDIAPRGIFTLTSNDHEYLIVVGDGVIAENGEIACMGDCYSADTKIKIYKLSGVKMPKLQIEETILGYYVDSRILHGDQLTIATSYYVSPDSPQTNEETCQATFYPITDDGSYVERTALHGFDFKKIETADFHYTQSIMGAYQGIYASANTLYLYKYTYLPESTDFTFAGPGKELTTVLRVDAQSEEKSLLTAVASVEGQVLSSWAFKEYGDSLAIATSNFIDRSNHMFVLQHTAGSSSLSLRSQSQPYGLTEDIRSVRYIDDKAYVVTFRVTDPLYVIDLSNLDNLKILSELKVPGFSKYMQPMAEDLLVGIGYAAEDDGQNATFGGVQLSLFDISDDYNPKAVVQLELGVLGSFSDALFHHHAFYVNNERQWIGFPLVQLDNPAGEQWWDRGQDIEFNGAKIYKVETSGFVHHADISHSDLFTPECREAQRWGSFWWASGQQSLDINRIFDLDGRLMSLSRFALREHDVSNPSQVLNEALFATSDVQCDIADIGIIVNSNGAD